MVPRDVKETFCTRSRTLEVVDVPRLHFEAQIATRGYESVNSSIE